MFNLLPWLALHPVTAPAPPFLREGSPKEKATQDDIFGDDLSISSEDEEDVKSKKAVIEDSGDDEVTAPSPDRVLCISSPQVARYDDSEKRKGGSDSDSDVERKKAAMVRSFRKALNTYDTKHMIPGSGS